MLEELIAKFKFWYARKYIKHKTHYDFMLDESDTNAMAVRLLKKYPGVIVEYSNMHMSSDTQMSYDISIIANPNLCDVDSNRFKNYTVDIFRSIINDSVEHAKEQNENRNIDSFQSDSERAIHEEVIAVSEERVSKRKPRKKTVRRSKKIHPQVQQSASDSSTGD